jgi:hypothetical protein
LQRAGQMLEQGQYPNLGGLARSLAQTLTNDKQRVQSKRRAYKFEQTLHDVFRTFGPLSRLNNEEVDTLRQTLAYLGSQQEHFQTASPVVQSELEKSLSESKLSLKRLAKQYEATSAVAEELVTSHILDDIFADSSGLQASNTVPNAVPPKNLTALRYPQQPDNS